MPLNDNGIPCESVGERVGPVVQRVGKPDTRQIEFKLIPATERGWGATLTFERPMYNNSTGRIELYQYKFERERFRCSRCDSFRHILLKLVGWSYKLRRTRTKGRGVIWRCFKCDVTQGPVDEDRYCLSKDMVKPEISRKEALAICEKYGLDCDRI